MTVTEDERKAESRQEAADAPRGVWPDLLLGILHLRRQPLDHSIQLVELFLGFAEVLTLLVHCGLHFLALRIGGKQANNLTRGHGGTSKCRV